MFEVYWQMHETFDPDYHLTVSIPFLDSWLDLQQLAVALVLACPKPL
jgi:hypothetical protein